MASPRPVTLTATLYRLLVLGVRCCCCSADGCASISAVSISSSLPVQCCSCAELTLISAPCALLDVLLLLLLLLLLLPLRGPLPQVRHCTRFPCSSSRASDDAGEQASYPASCCAQQPQPNMAASPTRPPILNAMPPDDTPAATRPQASTATHPTCGLGISRLGAQNSLPDKAAYLDTDAQPEHDSMRRHQGFKVCMGPCAPMCCERQQLIWNITTRRVGVLHLHS